LFTRTKFELSVSGREDIPFSIIETDDFFVKGYEGISSITDSCCCENVWNAFYESGTDKKLKNDKIYVTYHNQGDDVLCCIGEKAEDGVKVPKNKWACFKMNTVDDDIVNQTYSKILYIWLPSANLKRNDTVPTVEVYPFQMNEDGFEWEIRIPIK
jgi:predicted transcriptional regulator YdeE